MPQLSNVTGANYHPSWSWNAYQTWANYDEGQLTDELDMAQSLGVDSLRINLSYEYWRDEAPFTDGTTANAHIGELEHFLTECSNRGIKPVLILFESPPKADPANVDPMKIRYGISSPSVSQILQPRDWEGYTGSPKHFTRRMANYLSGDNRVLAVEIINEPGSPRGPAGTVLNRHDFTVAMAQTYRNNDTSLPISIGTKDTIHADYYENERGVQMDVWEFHANMKPDAATWQSYVKENTQRTNKPVWCTEWQRTLEEPPHRGLPYLQSLAPTVKDMRSNGELSGDFFWGLMFKPAYLRDPRNNVGRTNGVFHPDGAVFNVEDANAVAGRNTGLPERTEYPASWQSYPEYSAFPDPSELQDGDGGGEGGGLGFGTAETVLGLGAIGYILSRRGDDN